MIDIQGILEALKPPSRRSSFCEAIRLRHGEHTFCSHENDTKNCLLDLLGSEQGYHAEWIEQKDATIKTIVSRRQNEQFWKIRYREIRGDKNKIFLETNTTLMLHGAIHGAIERMMQEINPFCHEGDVIQVPGPNTPAHERLEWMQKAHSLEGFEKILENTIYHNREEWIWRIHRFQNTDFLLVHNKRSRGVHQGEIFPPSIVWIGTQPL